MAYDLRTESWIPWRRRGSDDVHWGSPAALVDWVDSDTPPVVGLATPRPDFDGALQEFLIGLLSAALRPVDERAWRALWNAPPTSAQLQAALDALPSAFNLDGDGARFFQAVPAEMETQGESWSAESLLLDTPGSTPDEARKRQFVTDLFVKPGGIERLSRPAAAMALLTLQTYATEGGRGHLTSMRGGGPLTTLIDPRLDLRGEPLWYKLWANAETTTQLADRSPHRTIGDVTRAFPWLAATRAADLPSSKVSTPSDVHPLQSYFGMPRRVRLLLGGAGHCDLTGCEDEATVAAFRMRTYGVKYEGWLHPLSPYYRKGNSGPWFPEHGRRGGLGWRDWLGIALTTPHEAGNRPATAVAAFTRRAVDLGIPRFRIHAFGYKSDHKKVLDWTEASLPAFASADENRQQLLYSTARALVDATGLAASELLRAVKTALFQKADEAPGDLGACRTELWAATERPFYDVMADLAPASLEAGAVGELAASRQRAFAEVLRDRALDVFDRWCPPAGRAPDVLRRRVVARHDLRNALIGRSPLGEKLYEALGVPLPGGGRAGRAAKKAATKRASRTSKEDTT